MDFSSFHFATSHQHSVEPYPYFNIIEPWPYFTTREDIAVSSTSPLATVKWLIIDFARRPMLENKSFATTVTNSPEYFTNYLAAITCFKVYHWNNLKMTRIPNRCCSGQLTSEWCYFRKQDGSSHFRR